MSDNNGGKVTVHCVKFVNMFQSAVENTSLLDGRVYKANIAGGRSSREPKIVSAGIIEILSSSNLYHSLFRLAMV